MPVVVEGTESSGAGGEEKIPVKPPKKKWLTNGASRDKIKSVAARCGEEKMKAFLEN